MRFIRQSLTGLFLLGLTLGLLAYAGQIVFSAVQERISAEPRERERRERVFAVNVVTAKEETVSPTLIAYGEIQSRRTLEIRTKSSGTLVELADSFEEGGEVEAGQLLARVDPTDAEFALSRAASELEDSEAERREAERGLVLANDELAAAQDQAKLYEKAFARQLDLENRGVGTAAAVELAELSAAQARQSVITRRQAVAGAEARIDQAETRFKRSQIAFNEAERRLQDTKVIAGFSGALSEVTVVEGRLVSANERLGTLIDSASLEVAFRVSTSQYRRLLDDTGELVKAPIVAALSTLGSEIVAQGVITRDGAAVGENNSGRLVFAALYDTPAMKPGDFVTVRIEEPKLPNIVRLPASALGAENDVLALTEEDRLESIAVTLVRRQVDEVLVLGEGIVGRRIVANRTPLLGSGIKVRPITPPKATTPQNEVGLLDLSEDRRARLIAFVEGNKDLSETDRSRLLDQLARTQVPAGVVERLESRIGG